MANNEKKGLIAEFKEFISKGNVMNLAVGVIIGAAFQNIVSALTSSFINPLIALITGGCERDEAGNLVLVGGQFTINGVAFDYGSFISAVLNFFIMAVILFAIVKAVNKAMEIGKKKEEEPEPEPEKEPEPTKEELLLTEIRDLLKEKK
ncbi:MAG: large conductance mechanosensitive channel protein MscL [Huintestinicola sp.]